MEALMILVKILIVLIVVAIAGGLVVGIYKYLENGADLMDKEEDEKL